MVLRVCQRILHSVHDAEDVFQAVFLVFSRKAGALRRSEAVGCWLHQTAYRLALKARTQLARQRKRDHHVAKPTAAADPLAELSVREGQAILDEELARLPEKYRAPLVLCCLEGQTRDEAARQLSCSAKLIKSRLEAARERLRDRLIRRGLTLPAALAASLLAEENAPAAVHPLLVRATVQAAQSWPADSASPMVAWLAESALRGTGMVKAKIAVGLLLLTSALAAGWSAFAPSRDRYGDPLPPGALARLGTLRFRTDHTIEQIAFSPDGKLLATATSYPDANTR
jgi:RNA polymerase sigma factor (sigma-70 family)